MRGISTTVYLVPPRAAGTVLDVIRIMLNSQRGKAASEWSAWILAYEHTLRARYNDTFVNRLDLDLHQLRLRCERGDDPIKLAKNDFIPLMSNRVRARVMLERQRIMDDLIRIRAEKRARRVQRVCIAFGAVITICFAYLSYSNWTHAAEIRAQDQAYVEWRQSVGLR